MKNRTLTGAGVVGCVALLALAGERHASARDEKLKMPIKAALERPETQKKLDVGIRLYFAEAPHPAPEAELGELKVDKKTRAIGRSNEDACAWVFLSALIALQDHARTVGANAVVGIESFYKDETLSSDAEYLCNAGRVMASTSLGGKFVRLPLKK